MTTANDDAANARPWALRRKDVRPLPIGGAQEEWVRTSQLAPDQLLPLVMEPALPSVDLAQWLAGHRELVETALLRHGGVLLRGFGLRDQADFDRALKATGVELLDYLEGATPRTELGGRVYTSTEFPSEETIAPHNELCYVATWPRKIWFFCVQPPPVGGETPIFDVRGVLQRIPAAIRERFARQGWMLVRNFGEGFGPSWQHSYRQHEPDALEAYCRQSGIELEWKGGDRLRTRQVRPATARHPVSGDEVWFNHVAFWHVSSLKPETREAFLADLGVENLPYNTYYGDGTPIADDVIAQLRDAYEQEEVAFSWRQGDLLMLDNMLVAHGRRPFSGPRRILTAMGEPENRRG